MALKDNELAMLDKLIYSDYMTEGSTIEGVIHNVRNNPPDEMNEDYREYLEIANFLEKNEEILHYQITDVEYTPTGGKIACIVDDVKDPKDVNVVFRGTASDVHWRDNGEGFCVEESLCQKEALEYINKLPAKYENNITVTGHSKGGNMAQFVTIKSDRIKRCCSVNGQGFSDDFVNSNFERIKERQHLILSVAGDKDYVNTLGHSIAGKTVYISLANSWDVLGFHDAFELFDENGNFRQQVKQNIVTKTIGNISRDMIDLLPELEQHMIFDGVMALLVNKKTLKDWLNIGITAVGSKFIIKYNLIPMQILKLGYEAYKKIEVEVEAALYVFKTGLEYLGRKVEDFTENVCNKIKQGATVIYNKICDVGDKLKDFGKTFINGITSFVSKVVDFSRSIFANETSSYYGSYFRVDTYRLREYAQRLRRVQRIIVDLDNKLNWLYDDVELTGLVKLIKMDNEIGYNYTLSRCINYLEETADEFERVENRISNF